MTDWLTIRVFKARARMSSKSLNLIAIVLLGYLLSTATSCSTAGQPVRPSDEEATIHLNVNLIQLSAYVVDASGKRVSGLERSDFQLFVDGKPKPITSFETDDAPVAGGILVDNSASMTHKGPEVVAAALAFARVSNPMDQMFVIHFSGQVRLGLPADQPFTSDISELELALSQFSAEGTTALYDALMLGTAQFQKTRLDRKVLLVVSDGGDNSSRASFEDALNSAEKAGIVIYCIGIYDNTDLDRNPQILTRVSDMTGGEAFFPVALKDVTNTCIKIARDIRQQYTLGFEGAEDGRYHRIEITAFRPQGRKLMVRARAGYYAPQQ